MTHSFARLASALLIALTLAAQAADPPKFSSGQLLYVPIYSSVFFSDGKRTIELAATLSIHNVDMDRSITLDRVDYHDTQGKLIRKYLAAPITLAPLETKNFVVERSDTAGGTGANFIVGWSSPKGEAVTPIVEALMINTTAGQGISFTSSGKVVKELSVPTY